MDRGIEVITMVGDVFDDPYPSQASQIELLNVLTDYPDIDFLLLRGNHDYADLTIDALRILKWTKKLKSNIKVIDKPKIMKIGDINYHFQPHPFIEDVSSKADFGIGHFAVNGAQGDNGFKVTTKNQPKGRWILGDFHTEQQGKVKSCEYDYVGSLTQLSWEEKPRKSYICMEDGLKVRRKIELGYKLIKHTVASDDELAEIKFSKSNFYYMKTKNGYLLPKSWALEHPEVVRQSAIGVKKDKRAALLTDSEVKQVNPNAFLEPYLHSKKHPPNIISRAIELAKTLKAARNVETV